MAQDASTALLAQDAPLTPHGRRVGRPSKGVRSYHISLPEDLKHWADAHARAAGDSTSGLIARLLDDYRAQVETTSEAS